MARFSKHPLERELDHSGEDLRWATSSEVADYRAMRLKCERIVDFGCGIGLQSFSFAKTCRHVLGIDIDASKIEKARKNAATLGIHNVEFMCADALSEDAIAKVKGWKPDVIFLDPHRPEGEDRRELSSIRPIPNEFKEAYVGITECIAIELPPQIKSVVIDGELEYLSVNGELRRLTLYTGPLARAKASAVVLPGGARLQGEPSKARHGEVSSYLYEVDPAVAKAGLVDLVSKEAWAAIEGKHILLSSRKLLKGQFFKARYKVLERLSFDLTLVSASLKSMGAGKVVLRYSIEPSRYWTERNALENGLNGSRTLYLFRSGDEALICEAA